ncbi:hypothetical protein Tco_0484058 [Tanacetum coccineum]
MLCSGQQLTTIHRRTIDHSAGGKLCDLNSEESWALLEDLALYDNESWNDPRDFTKPVKASQLPSDVLNSFRFVLPVLTDIESSMLIHSSNPPINAILAYLFKEATISQTSLWQPKIETKPPQPEEPEPTLEDEFQDLHLNVPVLEVLAHALIYNAILDIYVIFDEKKLGSSYEVSLDDSRRMI